MSKAYGFAGLRIGWLACPDRAMLARFERYKLLLSMCNSAPSEILATIALKAREPILARNRAIMEANLRESNAFFAEYPDFFDWYVPAAASIGFPRYTGPEGVEEFARRLVEESGVLVLPASLFCSELGATPSDRFGFGFGKSYVPAGLAAMRAWLETR